MSKRVQYAQSLPQLPAAPAAEAGRAVLYAKAGGLFVRLPDGTEVGPLAAGGLPQSLEVDFGTLAVDEKVMTVALPGVVAGRPLMIEQSGDAATGRQADENEMEQFEVNGRTLAGQLVLNFNALAGSRLQGRFKVNYMVG